MSGAVGQVMPKIMERDDLNWIEWLLVRAAKGFAIAGGLGFVGMVSMSLVSVVGRKLWSVPVNGDVEIVQVATAVSAAALIPYCTLAGEHLKVDFFTEHVRSSIKTKMDSFAYVLMTLVFLLIAWRTGLHAVDMRESGEVTTLREIPVWIPVAGIVPSLIMVALCAAYRSVTLFNTGKGGTS